MANVADTCAKIDGMLGTMALSSNAGQHVAAWMQMCKDIMHLPANRNLTTWKFQAISDIDEDGCTETGDADLIAATKLYAALIGSVDVTAEAAWVGFLDADSGTLSGAALGTVDALMALIEVPVAASASAEEYTGCVWPQGIILGTGLTVYADGVAGTNVDANELRGWLLFI